MSESIREYSTVMVDIKDIKLDGENPNKMNEDMEKRLGGSMVEFGNTQDVIIDKNTMILADGEHRLKEYIKKGMTRIPAKLIPFKNDAHRRLYRQAANKIRGMHDESLDASEYLKILESTEKDLLKMATGLTLGDVEKHLRMQKLLNKEEDFDIDKTANEIKFPSSRPGDIYLLGSHRLMCGDCTNPKDLNNLMSKDQAQMSFTDPPYNVNYDQDKSPGGTPQGSKGKIKNDNMTPEDFKKFAQDFTRAIIDNTSGAIYICMSCKEWGTIMDSFQLNGGHWSSTIIWNKSSFVMGRQDYHRKFEPLLYGWKEGNEHYWIGDRDQSDVWDIDRQVKNDLHPTMKPLELCMRAINNSSEEEGIVLDLFGGSGSTLIAAEKLGRRCFMMEIEPLYCDVICKRWEQFTGLKAQKESNLSRDTISPSPSLKAQHSPKEAPRNAGNGTIKQASLTDDDTIVM